MTGGTPAPQEPAEQGPGKLAGAASAAGEIARGAALGAKGGAGGAALGAGKAALKVLARSPKGRKFLLFASLSGLLTPLIGMLVVVMFVGALATTGAAAKGSADHSLQQAVATAGFTENEMAVILAASNETGITWHIVAAILHEQKWRFSGTGPLRIVENRAWEVPDPGAENLQAALTWVAWRLRERADRTVGLRRDLDIGNGGTVFDNNTVVWSDPDQHDREVVLPWIEALKGLPLEGAGDTWAEAVIDQAVRWRLGQITPAWCEAPTGVIASGEWVQPTIDADGKVGSPFGMRFHPILHKWRLHAGADLGNKLGTPIYAASSGRVVFVGYNSGAGHYLKIDHGAGIATQYLHMRSRADILVSVGDQVTVGQQIAKMGSAGLSTSPHLHFEVVVNGKKVDPAKFYAERGLDLAATPTLAGPSGDTAPPPATTLGSTASITGSMTLQTKAGRSVVLTEEMLRTAQQIAAAIGQLNTSGGHGWSQAEVERLFVMSVMTGLQESTLGTNNGWENDDVGLYQQRSKVGWYADETTQAANKEVLRSVAYQTANLVAGHTVKVTAAGGNPVGYHIPGLIDQDDWRSAALWKVIADTQRPAAKYRKEYDKWQPVGEALLAAFKGLLTAGTMPGCSASGQLTVVHANILYELSDKKFMADLVKAAEGADIIALNEVGKGRDPLLRKFAEEYGFQTTRSGQQANRLLISDRLGQVVDSGAIAVHGAMDDNDERDITWATVQTGTSTITVMTTHALPSIESKGKPDGPKDRLAASEKLFREFAEFAAKRAALGHIVIGTGDMNVDYERDRREQYAGFPWTAIEKRGVGAGLRSVYTASGVRGDGTISHGRHIDYIYHWESPGSPVGNSGYRIDNDTNSDHGFITAWYSTGTGPTEEPDDE